MWSEVDESAGVDGSARADGSAEADEHNPSSFLFFF